MEIYHDFFKIDDVNLDALALIGRFTVSLSKTVDAAYQNTYEWVVSGIGPSHVIYAPLIDWLKRVPFRARILYTYYPKAYAGIFCITSHYCWYVMHHPKI